MSLGQPSDQKKDFLTSKIDVTCPSGSMERRLISSGSVTAFSSSINTGALYLLVNEGPCLVWFRPDGIDPVDGYGVQSSTLRLGIPIGPGQSFEVHQPLEAIPAGNLKFMVVDSGGSASMTLYRSSRNI